MFLAFLEMGVRVNVDWTIVVSGNISFACVRTPLTVPFITLSNLSVVSVIEEAGGLFDD